MLAFPRSCAALADPQLSIVEVFKTNVASAAQAACVVQALHHRFELVRVSFDLQDCDRVLRVQATEAAGPGLWESLVRLVSSLGVDIEMLPD